MGKGHSIFRVPVPSYGVHSQVLFFIGMFAQDGCCSKIIDDSALKGYTVYIQPETEGDSMEVQVREWGNSQGIRFPKAVLREAGIALNDKLTVEVENGKIILYRSFHHRTLEERIRESGCELSGIGELDWGEAQGNEVW